MRNTVFNSYSYCIYSCYITIVKKHRLLMLYNVNRRANGCTEQSNWMAISATRGPTGTGSSCNTAPKSSSATCCGAHSSPSRITANSGAPSPSRLSATAGDSALSRCSTRSRTLSQYQHDGAEPLQLESFIFLMINAVYPFILCLLVYQ